MFGVLLMTLSRCGCFSLLIVFLLVGVYARINRKSSREAKLFPRVIGLVLLSRIWFGGEGLSNRILKQSIYDIRLNVAAVSITMASDYPLLGAGNGLWEESFAQYRDISTNASRFKHAHNDYLEVLVGQGLLGFLLIGGALIYMLKDLLIANSARRDPLAKGILFGVLVGVVAILVHGFLDFNFQIAGNMLVFMGIIASGLTLGKKP